MFKFLLALKLIKMPRYDEHFQAFSGFVREKSSILVWKNGALRWSIFVGKQKHNIQRPMTCSEVP